MSLKDVWNDFFAGKGDPMSTPMLNTNRKTIDPMSAEWIEAYQQVIAQKASQNNQQFANQAINNTMPSNNPYTTGIRNGGYGGGGGAAGYTSTSSHPGGPGYYQTVFTHPWASVDELILVTDETSVWFETILKVTVSDNDGVQAVQRVCGGGTIPHKVAHGKYRVVGRV